MTNTIAVQVATMFGFIKEFFDNLPVLIQGFMFMSFGLTALFAFIHKYMN